MKRLLSYLFLVLGLGLVFSVNANALNTKQQRNFINSNIIHDNIGCDKLSDLIGGLNQTDLLWFDNKNGENYQFALINTRTALTTAITTKNDKIYYVCENINNLKTTSDSGDSAYDVLKDRNLIKAGASILDSNLSRYAYHNSLKGLEFFSGIPGNVGGAVKMNAGCYGSETTNVLKEISIYTKEGEKKILSNKDLGFSYRNSNLSDNDIVTSVVFKGELGEKSEIESRVKEIKLMRETSQPIKTKTGGSTFKNPKGKFAARLIEQADCKGLTFGNASVSTKHSNFLINLGNAKANDIETLGKIIQERVMKKLNIFLEWEIKIIGDNSDQ